MFFDILGASLCTVYVFEAVDVDLNYKVECEHCVNNCWGIAYAVSCGNTSTSKGHPD